MVRRHIAINKGLQAFKAAYASLQGSPLWQKETRDPMFLVIQLGQEVVFSEDGDVVFGGVFQFAAASFSGN
jgi:hypothetical protein